MMTPMDPRPPPCPDPLADAMAWVEQQLDRPQAPHPATALTLERIAAQAGLSPYHFSRLFTARMGRSVMAHVRGRRLVQAARRLCHEPGLRLVELALDSGFESQEAFTRAFKRLFGASPGRFRSGFAVEPIEGQFPMTLPPDTTASVTRLPDLAVLPTFTVAGPSRQFDEASKVEIPQLWSALIGLLPFPGQVKSWATYGVVYSVNAAEGCFQYLAGVGVEPGCTPPPGFTRLEIPAATYAVFRITLNGGPLQPQIMSAMARIWGELLPASGLQLADGPDFELYDGRFDPKVAGSVIDFHIPVRF